MKKEQLIDLMTYIYAEHDVRISAERVQVWYDQLRDETIETCMLAAKILLSQETFGIPKIADFLKALERVKEKDEQRITWSEAWDGWVAAAIRYGYYNKEQAFEEYKKKHPVGAQALGTMYAEWFSLLTTDVPTFRAQFRQKYEGLQQKEKLDSRLPVKVKQELELSRQTNRIALPHAAGNTALALVEGLNEKKKS